MNKASTTKKVNTKILKLFCDIFWFAPSDVFLRTADAIFWSEIIFSHPILDIGCGDGKIDKLLFQNKSRIDLGLDNSKDVINRAKKSKFYKKVIYADAAEMPFMKKSFSMVIANSTFEHIENDILAIREVSRVLKEGGKFIFSVPTRRFYSVLRRNISKKREFDSFNKRVSHLHYRSLADWKKILNKYDLNVTKYTYYFPRRAVLLWYKLFKIAILKPYKRELWSYLQDSPYSKYIPKRIISNVLYGFLLKYFSNKDMFSSKGCWIFIEAVRTKQ